MIHMSSSNVGEDSVELIKKAFFERVNKNNTDILEYVLLYVMERAQSPQKKGLYRDFSSSLYMCKS